jgi:Zn finger protein HypA/HybF involved in hydrogenase expression
LPQLPQAEVPSIAYYTHPHDLKFEKYRCDEAISEAFLRNGHPILIMSDRCIVYYFLCPSCRRTAAVPESFRYGLTCPYCNSEMKAIVTED